MMAKAMSSTIVVGLAQGGTVVVLYGLIGISIINAFLAVRSLSCLLRV